MNNDRDKAIDPVMEEIAQGIEQIADDCGFVAVVTTDQDEARALVRWLLDSYRHDEEA